MQQLVATTHLANAQPMAHPTLPVRRRTTGARCATPAMAQHRNPEGIHNTPDMCQATNTDEEEHPSVTAAANISSISMK